MKEFVYTITDPLGIHARPAGLLVRAIKGVDSTVTITKADGRSAEGPKLMAIMGLGIKHGDTITVTVEGANEEADAAVLEKFFQENV